MRRAIRTAVETFAVCFEPPGRVVEIGSLYLPGYESLSDLRPFFANREYVGCDIRRGLGVDRLEDAHALSFDNGSVGTVLLFEILEHLPRPNVAISEARRVLSENGILALSVPFQYRLHGFPSDYWRFTASGVDVLLADFPQRTILSVGPRDKPAFVFAVAAKSAGGTFAERSGLFTIAVKAAYRRTLLRGHVSALKERGRDLLGLLMGRAHVGVWVFDPNTRPFFLPEAEDGHV